MAFCRATTSRGWRVFSLQTARGAVGWRSSIPEKTVTFGLERVPKGHQSTRELDDREDAGGQGADPMQRADQASAASRR